MAKKVSEMTVGEVACLRYDQTVKSAGKLQEALYECARCLVLDGKVEHFTALVQHMAKRDPKEDLVQTSSVRHWIEDVAELRISKNNVVWPSRKVDHDEDWFKELLNKDTWSKHGKKLQVTKSMTDPFTAIVRQIGDFVGMGGMLLDHNPDSELMSVEVGMPHIYTDVKAYIKTDKYTDNLAGKMEYLLKNDMDFIKVN